MKTNLKYCSISFVFFLFMLPVFLHAEQYNLFKKMGIINDSSHDLKCKVETVNTSRADFRTLGILCYLPDHLEGGNRDGLNFGKSIKPFLINDSKRITIEFMGYYITRDIESNRLRFTFTNVNANQDPIYSFEAYIAKDKVNRMVFYFVGTVGSMSIDTSKNRIILQER